MQQRGALIDEIRGDLFCAWLSPPPDSGSRSARLSRLRKRRSSEQHSPPALILAAHLTQTATHYFPLRGRAALLHSGVDRFVTAPAVAAGLRNGTLRIHVVHDSPAVSGPLSMYRGVALHRMQSVGVAGRDAVLPAQDARWALFGKLLEELRPDPRTCVFLVDFSDVSLLRSALDRLCASVEAEAPNDGAVSAKAEELAPSTLFVGSDMCHADGARKFLRHQLNASGFNASAPMRRFLASRTASYVHNVGILGGRLPVVERMRRLLASGTDAHYASRPAQERPRYVVDSVLLNDLLLRDAHTPLRLVGGWPRGFVNLPMAGDVCVPPKFNNFCLAAQFRNCRAKHLLAAMAPHYWWAHKVGCGGVIGCKAEW